MPRPILLDTDIMVDFLRGHPKAVSLVKAHSDSIMLSSIVVAELYAGVKGDRELATLDDFAAFCYIVPVTQDIARTGGIYKRDYAKSHGGGGKPENPQYQALKKTTPGVDKFDFNGKLFRSNPLAGLVWLAAGIRNITLTR